MLTICLFFFSLHLFYLSLLTFNLKKSIAQYRVVELVVVSIRSTVEDQPGHARSDRDSKRALCLHLPLSKINMYKYIYLKSKIFCLHLFVLSSSKAPFNLHRLTLHSKTFPFFLLWFLVELIITFFFHGGINI